ncbi:MAG: CCA tRNA nucleotidyltransferase [Acidobacteriaceae bacterium]|nr:CCA tRNA nucleotidyltransferase [Acidobacteriaceae bacterium]
MSDYMLMLDNHLTGEQSKAVAVVREAAEQAHLNVFLVGGAMRDMMGGFPIRDLDFAVEGPAVKFAKSLAEHIGAEIVSIDDHRKAVELRFPGGVSGSIAMTRSEKYARAGGRSTVQPAAIHEDLRARDFTVNAIALSLGQASRGLLLDPVNGLGDLARKELRAASNYALYDDPSRLFRLIRFRARFGFSVEARSLSQYQNAREAKLETKIPPAALNTEFRQIGIEPNAGEILRSLEEEHLLSVVSPVLAGPKLNLAGFQKLLKARQCLAFGLETRVTWSALLWFLLLERLSQKERAQVIKALELPKEEAESAMKLEARASKLEKELAATRLPKPSAVYNIASKVPGEVVLFALMRSGQRVVLDRLKNYFQKYLPLAQEVSDSDVIRAGAEPGTAKFHKIKAQLIASKLDARPKKVVLEEPPPPPPVTGRRSITFAR